LAACRTKGTPPSPRAERGDARAGGDDARPAAPPRRGHERAAKLPGTPPSAPGLAGSVRGFPPAARAASRAARLSAVGATGAPLRCLGGASHRPRRESVKGTTLDADARPARSGHGCLPARPSGSAAGRAPAWAVAAHPAGSRAAARRTRLGAPLAVGRAPSTLRRSRRSGLDVEVVAALGPVLLLQGRTWPPSPELLSRKRPCRHPFRAGSTAMSATPSAAGPA
jgi:hypothetical protein